MVMSSDDALRPSAHPTRALKINTFAITSPQLNGHEPTRADNFEGAVRNMSY